MSKTVIGQYLLRGITGVITCELLEGISKENKGKKNHETIVKAESMKLICNHKSSFLSWLCIFTLMKLTELHIPECRLVIEGVLNFE